MRSNQSILKEISPEYSLEGLMWKLKLQYFGHLMWRADSLENTLILGKIEGKKRRGQQRRRWLESITDSKDMNLIKLWEIMEDRGTCSAAVHGVAKRRPWLSNWQQQLYTYIYIYILLFAMLWRKAWQPTPVFLPGESSWIEEPPPGYSPWGLKESDMTERLSSAIFPIE